MASFEIARAHMQDMRERIADLQYEAGMYKSLYEHAQTPPCKVCGCTVATLVCDACYSRHADSSTAAPATPKELGDTIPIDEMVTRLEKRGAELNDGEIATDGQLMLKAAFYIKRLASHVDALSHSSTLRPPRPLAMITNFPAQKVTVLDNPSVSSPEPNSPVGWGGHLPGKIEP
jgi:hypothetical protein